MANHFAYPEASHFGSEFALGVEPGILGDPYPRHPRGQARAGRYVDRGRDGGTVLSRTFSYVVPDGSDPTFPLPGVGERIYVARWYPGEVFIGGWGFATAFSGIGDLVAEYRESDGSTVRLKFADAANLVAQADYNAFETEVVNEVNPTALALDLFFELVEAPQAGERLKGHLDFVSSK